MLFVGAGDGPRATPAAGAGTEDEQLFYLAWSLWLSTAQARVRYHEPKRWRRAVRAATARQWLAHLSSVFPARCSGRAGSGAPRSGTVDERLQAALSPGVEEVRRGPRTGR